ADDGIQALERARSCLSATRGQIGAAGQPECSVCLFIRVRHDEPPASLSTRRRFKIAEAEIHGLTQQPFGLAGLLQASHVAAYQVAWRTDGNRPALHPPQ